MRVPQPARPVTGPRRSAPPSRRARTAPQGSAGGDRGGDVPLEPGEHGAGAHGGARRPGEGARPRAVGQVGPAGGDPATPQGGRRVAVRRDRDLLWFVGGLATLTFAWFALRTVH